MKSTALYANTKTVLFWILIADLFVVMTADHFLDSVSWILNVRK